MVLRFSFYFLSHFYRNHITYSKRSLIRKLCSVSYPSNAPSIITIEANPHHLLFPEIIYTQYFFNFLLFIHPQLIYQIFHTHCSHTDRHGLTRERSPLGNYNHVFIGISNCFIYTHSKFIQLLKDNLLQTYEQALNQCIFLSI